MVFVTSVDGTRIWAEATGTPSKPAIVFIPGFSYTSLVFDKQWTDPFMKTNFFMVRYHTCPPQLLVLLLILGLLFSIR